MTRLAAAITAAVAFAVPSAAVAAPTVGVNPATGYAEYNGTQKADDLNLQFAGGDLSFLDAGGQLVAGPNCVAGTPVFCHAIDANVNLGAGADRFDSFTDGHVNVSGGSGDDDLTGNGVWTAVAGDAGNDTIRVGSNGDTRASGGPGDDSIRGVFNSAVHDDLSGDAGDDLVYGFHLRSDVSGGAGDDDLFMRLDGTVLGGAGDDVLIASSADSGLRTLDGGGGDDTIVGRGGSTITAGTGDDVIDASGDTPEVTDTIDCGSGRDTVYADPGDAVARNCETRRAGPMPSNSRVRAAINRLSRVFGVTPGV